jgi:polysaccharide export outer membrane protein
MTVKFHLKNIAERSRSRQLRATLVALGIVAASAGTFAQAPQPRQPTPLPRQTPPAPAPTPSAAAPTNTAPPVVPPDYTIGTDDVLSIVFWRDKDMSSDVAVRPDGKISLPLLNDVHAAGLTPTQLKDRLTEISKEYVEDPSVTVVVKQINSRRVFIIGEVGKPGPYSLGGPTTVLQFISISGGLGPYAKAKKILIMRTENGKPITLKFNYEEVIVGKNMQQNIELKPGDTIIVP